MTRWRPTWRAEGSRARMPGPSAAERSGGEGGQAPAGLGGDDPVGGLAGPPGHRREERRTASGDDPGVLAGAAGDEAGATRMTGRPDPGIHVLLVHRRR